jgi:hypothetical protein
MSSLAQRDPELLKLDGEKALLSLSLDVIRLLPRPPAIADPQSNAPQSLSIDLTLIEERQRLVEWAFKYEEFVTT